MAINISNIILDLQKRVNNVTTNTSSVEILNIMKAVKKADGSTLVSYDSDGALPDALTTNQKITFSGGSVRFNNGAWDGIALSGKTTSTYEAPPYVPPVVQTIAYPGTIDGYTTGGNSSPVILDTIQKFSFTVDGNSTDVSNLTTTNYGITGTGSKENGYALGGDNNQPAINKFSFTSATNATNVGALTAGTRSANNPGNSAMNEGYGYVCGGSQIDGSRIEKVSFTTDGGATDVGSLVIARSYMMGSSSSEYGYNSGSLDPVVNTGKIIDKFSFVSGGNAFTSGYLTEAMLWGAGLSSATYGYAAGNTRNIDKFPFAGEANGKVIGDLFSTLDGNLFQYPSGHSSTEYGYVTGGLKPTRVDNIEKFWFVSETVGTQVGNLLQASAYLGSHHV